MDNENASFWDKLKSGKVIVISAAVLLVVAIAFAVFMLLPKKTPRELYLESERKNFKKYSSQIKSLLNDFYTEQEPYIKNRHKKRSELSIDIKSEDERAFGITDSKEVFELLSRSKIIFDTKADPLKKESISNISLILESAPLIDATTFREGDRIGFTIPVLMPERYFTLSAERMEDVYKRFNIPLRPTRFVSKADVAETTVYSDEMMDKVMEKYGKLISGLIEENEVKLGKKVKVKVGEQEIKGSEITVTLDSEKTSTLMRELMDNASSDDTLLKLTYGNYAGIIKLLDEAAFFQLFNVLDSIGYLKLNNSEKALLDRINTKKDLESFGSSLKALGGRYSFPEGLKMTIIIDKTGTILDRKVTMHCNQNGKSDGVLLGIHTGVNSVKNQNFNNGFLTLDISKTGQGYDKERDFFSVNSNVTPSQKNGNKKGKIEITYRKSRGEVLESSAAASLDIEEATDELTLKRNRTIRYNVEIQGSSSDEKDTINGEINTVKWENIKRKTRNSNTSIVINAALPSFNLQNTEIALNAAEEDKFDIEEFTIPEVPNEKRFDLDNVSDADMARLENELMAAFGTFYLNNKPIIDAFIK